MDTLTERQKQVLEVITRSLDNRGCPPTLREISDDIGTRGTATAIAHLEALERKGHITRRSGSRGIMLVNRGAATTSLPIVGTVRAGTPEPATEDIQGRCCVDPSWIRGDGCFFLRVKGDSMIDAHILDGDLALIRPQPNADNGEIVVAVVDGAATLKRFYRERDHIRLQPENAALPPIIIRDGEAETVIVGKLLRIVRNCE
jgi:repressor LexA